MADLFLVIAVSLMVLAVVGSLVPMMPGALLSVAGILVYRWSTGYSSPDLFFLLVFTFMGLLAAFFDWFSGIVGARFGGASTRTSLVGGMAGLAGFILFGPPGMVIGVFGSIFLLEFERTGNRQKSLKASLYATVAVLGSSLVQFVVTLSLLIAFLLALFL